MTRRKEPSALVRPVKPWSDAQREVLRQLWDKTDPVLSAAQIGARIMRTKGQVIGQVRMMKLTPRASPLPSASRTPARSVRVSLPPVVVVRPVMAPITMPGVVNGSRLVGWPEVLRYWRERGGSGFPKIGDVNDMRRAEGRLPFKPVPGKFSPVPSLRGGT